MSVTSCAVMTERTTQVLATQEGSALAQRLLAQNAPPRAFAAALAEFCPEDQRDLLAQEIEELPESTIATIINAWVMAEQAGKSFRLSSERPDRPLEFARSRLVRFVVDMHEDGVEVRLSHVPGRHASWYRPAVAIAR